jgi:membrane-associated phospholipid phosphatase
LRWRDTKTANTLSTVFSFGLAPLASIGVGAIITSHDDRLHEVPADLLVIAESAVLALDLNEISKLVFLRERPYVHGRSPSDRAARRSSADNVSFFSGHTTLAFALAVSAGTVASMRHYRLAPLMWVSGLVLAAASGYLRIAADRHYATDVLTGIIVGSGVGFSVPYFAHRPCTERLHLSAMPLRTGGGVALSGMW